MENIPFGAGTFYPPKLDDLISFRGEIRYGFISHVCDAFHKEDIAFIIDEGFPRGRVVKKEIEKAIEKAEVLIPIISMNYATSIWCLDELVLIVKYHETKHILPVLYHVNQKDFMSQKGCFEKAFDDLGKTYTEEVVNRWRIAFRKIAEFTPHLVQIDRHESEVVQNITRDVCKMLKRVCSLDMKGPHDAIMNIPAAPDRFSSHRGSGIPFVNEYPEEKNLARMMTPGGMNSEAEFFIKKEASRMPPAQRDFLASELEDQVLQEELLSLFNEMKYYSSSEDDEQDVDGHPLPKVPVPSISMLVEIRTSLKTVIHGFYLGASVLQDASMLAKLKDSLSYLSQLGPRYGFHFGENVDALKEILKKQEAKLKAADNILDKTSLYHSFKEIVLRSRVRDRVTGRLTGDSSPNKGFLPLFFLLDVPLVGNPIQLVEGSCNLETR